VHPAAEGDVLAEVRAIDAEFVRLVEPAGIPVCSAGAQHHRRSGRHRDVADRGGLACQPEQAFHRGVRQRGQYVVARLAPTPGARRVPIRSDGA
jgi:hypothetical protein